MRPTDISSIIFILFATAASAQDWGLYGSWELVVASSGAGPAGYAFHHPTTVAGSLVFSGTDAATGANTSFALDAASLAWTQYPDVPPPGVARGGPFSFTIGGSVVLTNEADPNTLFVIDSAALGGGWRVVTTLGAPAGRDGERFIEWGGVLYFFGGWQSNGQGVAGTPHNDVYALDLTAALGAAAPPQTWQRSAADLVPGVPSARVGFTFVPFNVGAMLFGGVSLLPGAPLGSNPYNCFSAAFVALGFCDFKQHVHAFLPRNRAPAADSVTGNDWLQLALAGANGGPVPTGRFEHAAGAFGDQMFVFGGNTALGVSAELWAYNLHFQTWGQVAQTAPWPATGFYGTGAWLGRSFWILTAPGVAPGQRPPPGLPAPNQVWRWSPGGGAPGGGGSSSSSSAGSATGLAIAYGHTGGIVLGLLLGLANLFVLVRLAQNARVDLGCGLGGGKGGGGAGYYMAAPAGVASAYEAPSA